MNNTAVVTQPNVIPRKINIKKWTGNTILWIFLIGVAFFTLFPVILTLLGSFKTNMELTAGATIIPETWHFSNYVEAWKQAKFSTYTWNSMFVSIGSTIGTLLVASMAGYVVDRRRFWGRGLYIFIQASTMFISIGAVVLRPQFELMVKIHLNTTLWGVVLILISAHATTYFILIGFFKAIPRDVDEAAMIDGASFFTIYWRIILPLLAPGLGVTALFAFRAGWNEYILPLVFTMNNTHLQTLTVGLTSLRYGNSAAMQIHLMMAGACLSMLPILVVYLFANRAFMQVTAGSLKG
jgi:raffinose/stachyose/melibiose transport system permease protein